MSNTLLAQKFQQFAIVCASACFVAAAPAVHAAESGADVGIVVPDEPDDDSFTAGVPSAAEDSEARAIFQAWKRLDTGLAASIGVAVPSRQPIDNMSLRVPLMGVVKKLQNSRMASTLAFMMIEFIRRDAVRDYGAERGDIGWVLDDNQGMNAVAQAIDAKVNRVYQIYDKML